MNNKEMKVCKYLSKAYYDKLTINSYLDELEYISSKILATNKYYENSKVQGGKVTSNEDLIVKFVGYKALIEKQVDKLSREVEDIIHIINQIKDARYNAILVMRYIRHNDWDEIADKMGYDKRWALNLHLKAIKDIVKLDLLRSH